MKKATAITCVFLDIGGVLLTNGWDHHARKRATTNYKNNVDTAEGDLLVARKVHRANE